MCFLKSNDFYNTLALHKSLQFRPYTASHKNAAGVSSVFIYHCLTYTYFFMQNFFQCSQKVLKESVVKYLVDNTSEVGSDHVGIWDRPKRAVANSPTGGAYMIDPQIHIVLARNIKVK